MYSPRLFRELVVPRLQRISEVCHEHGAYHLFASDGDLWPVAEDLFGELSGGDLARGDHRGLVACFAQRLANPLSEVDIGPIGIPGPWPATQPAVAGIG